MGQWCTAVIVAKDYVFFHCCNEVPHKSSLRKTGFTLAPALRVKSILKGFKNVRQLVTLCLYTGSRGR